MSEILLANEMKQDETIECPNFQPALLQDDFFMGINNRYEYTNFHDLHHGSVPKDTSEDPLTRYRVSPLDQTWFSSQQNWLPQSQNSDTSSPHDVTTTRSLSSSHEEDVENTKSTIYRKKKISCRRASVRTPLSGSFKKSRRNRSNRSKKGPNKGNMKANIKNSLSLPSMDGSDMACLPEETIIEVKSDDTVNESQRSELDAPANDLDSGDVVIVVKNRLSSLTSSPLGLHRAHSLSSMNILFSDEKSVNKANDINSSTEGSCEKNLNKRNTSVSVTKSAKNADKNAFSNSDNANEKCKCSYTKSKNEHLETKEDDCEWTNETRRNRLLFDRADQAAALKGVIEDHIETSKELKKEIVNQTAKASEERAAVPRRKPFSPTESAELDNLRIDDNCKTATKPQDRKNLPSYSVSCDTLGINKKNESFASILNQWRRASDGKPCTHFLSPESRQAQSSRPLEIKPYVRRHPSVSTRKKSNTSIHDGPKEWDNTATNGMENQRFKHMEESPRRNLRDKKERVLHGNRNTVFEDNVKREVIADKVSRVPTANATTNIAAPQDSTSSEKSTVKEPSAANFTLLQMAQTRRFHATPKSRRDYKTVVCEFLKDADSNNDKRSKSVPRSSLVQPEAATRVGRSDTVIENDTHKSMRSKSQSLPRLREDSQMAESLSNLRAKLTKEYSDESKHDRLVNEILVKKSSRRAVHLLKKNSIITKPQAITQDSLPLSTSSPELCVDAEDLPCGNHIPNRANPPKSQVSERTKNTDNGSKVTQNLRRVEEAKESLEICRCSSITPFGNDDEMIEFFLPLTGTAVGGAKRQPGLYRPDEPTSLINILRPWQVEFLSTYGIFLGDQLVNAHHRSAKELAKALYRYRKKHNMKLFDIQCCASALKIWSKTSKTYVRSVRTYLAAGNLSSDFELPDPTPSVTSFLPSFSPLQVAACSTTTSVGLSVSMHSPSLSVNGPMSINRKSWH